MNKSNSKKLFRFVRKQLKREEPGSEEDSFDRVTQPSNSKQLSLTHSQSHPQQLQTLPFLQKSPLHYRSQTYPLQSGNIQQSTTSQDIHCNNIDSASQLSMENQTVIVRECPSVGSSEKGRFGGEGRKMGALVRLKVGHQIRSYEVQESMMKVQKQKEAVAIKEKIFQKLMRDSLSTHIQFG